MIDGTATVKSFKVTDTLQQVVNQVGSENTKLMTSFPRRIFTDEDLGRTLQDLGIMMTGVVNNVLLENHFSGLVPSAVLIQTMKKEN